jgi:hypothetical protein
MKRLVSASLATLGLLAAAAAPGHAQFGYTPPATSPFYRPPISPFLGLGLPGNAAINYFNLVQPQITTANQIGLLQGQLYQQQALLGGYGLGAYGYGGYGYPGAGVLITGYGAGFQNQWGFFQNWRTRAVAPLAGGLGGPGLGGAGLPIGTGLGYFNNATAAGVGLGFGFNRTGTPAVAPQAPRGPGAPGGTTPR